MAALQGTILASKIVPTDSLDTYATHDDKYGRGGHRSVDTIVERDNITTPRRKEGMTVYVKENKTKYILESGIENVNWKVDSSGDSSPSSLTVDSLKTILKELEDGAISSKEYIVLINREDDKVSALSLNALLDALVSSVGPSSGGGSSFTLEDKTKLDGIEEEATKNNTDSFLLDRKNHTGKIDIENVDGLGTILYSLETVEDNDDKLSGKVDKVTGKGLSANDYTDMEKDKLASIDINKIDNDIFDLEKRPYFMGRFQDEGDMLSLFFYDDDDKEDGKKLIYNDMYYYNIGLNSVMYYNGGTWIKGNNLNIVDDLESTVPGDALDANQGRILKGLIDNITTILNSDESNLDTLQEIVDFIKINRDTLNALTISSIAGLQNALNNKLDKNQNAISATKLETARTIGGVSFDGTANINLPGVNTAGNQNTTGNSATASKLATPVKINNKLFDGSANINLEEDAMVVKEKVVNLTGDIIQTSLGSVFIKTITKNTTLSLTTNYNIGETNSFILELTNGGNYTINWWDNIKWNGGVAPELTNNGKDILGFYSYDSPRVTIGVVLSKDAK